MALVVCWYDFVCFGIVAAAFFGSLWVLLRKEIGSRREDNTIYESLLVARPDCDGFVSTIPKAHVGCYQLWSSCWKGVHPGWLFVTRFVSFVVMAGFLSWDISVWGASIFVYYTEWTFTLVTFYFALGTVISSYGCWVYSKRLPSENGTVNGFLKREDEENITANTMTYGDKETRGNIKLQSYYTQQEMQQRAGVWGFVMQIIYQTSAGAVVLTDVIFWGLIAPFLSNAHTNLDLMTGCMHTLNAVFLLIDSALNNLPFPWFRMAYFMQWGCFYVVFQWVIHACGFTWWPYPFLELNTPWAPLWYFLMAVLHIPCYGAYFLIIRAKYSILPRWFPGAFTRTF